jgi:DNA-binding transcriptional regulator YdaS (Cro superfamily)
MAKKTKLPREELAAVIRESGDMARDWARKLACSPGRLSQVLAGQGGRVSSQLAINIHRETNGRVPGSSLRPDLWAHAKDVPVGGTAQ